MSRLHRLIVASLAVFVAFVSVTPSSAQTRSIRWQNWDVTIDINTDGSFDVRETYVLEFIGGDFTFGNSEILINQLTAIENIRVSSPERDYELEQSFAQEPFTYEWERQSDRYVVDWYYPPTSDATRTFILEYTVLGGMLIDDSAMLRNQEPGDRFFWTAIRDHAVPIESSTVVVNLPPGATVDTTVVPPAAFGDDAQIIVADDGTSVTYIAEDIPAGQELEVAVRFPSGIIQAERPPWQAGYVAEQTLVPVANLGLIALGALLLIGGGVAVYVLWFMRGRDPKSEAVPSYLTSPPSDLPPGVVGTLLDEKADLQDIIATLVDLARRGALVMQEQEEQGFLGFEQKKFVFRRNPDFDGETLPYEDLLLRSVFGRRDEVELEDLQEKFYAKIPPIQKALYREVVQRDLFPKSPQTVRQTWQGLGTGLMLVSAGLGVGGFVLLGEVVSAIFCPFVGAALAGLALTVTGQFMPAKTGEGSLEVAKWRAFRTYIKRIEDYTDLEAATEKFEQYLPYAIAFGLEKSWVNKFSRVESTPAPRWFIPVGIPYPYPGGTVMRGGGSEARSQPTLGDIGGDGMMGSLNSMSDGLFSMLNSTASTFTSVPQSSGSGGGGFSGGGFSAGGGGGGGSTSFG